MHHGQTHGKAISLIEHTTYYFAKDWMGCMGHGLQHSKMLPINNCIIDSDKTDFDLTFIRQLTGCIIKTAPWANINNGRTCTDKFSHLIQDISSHAVYEILQTFVVVSFNF